MAAARAMARRTSRPGTLIAARRLADDPRAAFRAVSGLVLALFVTTVAVVAITTQNAKDVTRFGSVADSNMLTDQIATWVARAAQPVSGAGPAAPADAAHRAAARGFNGVQGVAVVRAVPGLTIPRTFNGLSGNAVRPVQPGTCGRGLVRAARDRPRHGPLPGRGDSGGVPGRRVRP